MNSRIISRTPLQVVTLSQAKNQLNEMFSDENDTHIQLLIDVASELAESYTSRLLTIGTVETIIQGKTSAILPFGKIESITSATFTDDGSDANYTFEPISQKIHIASSDCSREIKLTYDAGYAENEIPNSAKMGVLRLVSSLYENREDTVTGVSVGDIPLNSTQVLNAIKI